MPPLKRYEFASDLNPQVIITIWAFDEDLAKNKLNRIYKTIKDFEILTN